MAPSTNAAADQQQLDKLLQQIPKHFLSDKIRPPDQAVRAVGRQLAQQFLRVLLNVPTTTSSRSDKDKDNAIAIASTTQPAADAVLRVLCQAELSRSLPHAFFESLTAATSTTTLQHLLKRLLPQWMVALEHAVLEENAASFNNDGFVLSGAHESLGACITAFAIVFTATAPTDRNDDDDDNFAVLHRRVQLPSTRQALVRECIRQVFSSDSTTARFYSHHLSSVVAAAVLALHVPAQERGTTLQHLLRAAWAFTSSNGSDPTVTVDLIQWMTEALNIYLLGWNALEDTETATASAELAAHWLTELAGLAEAAWLLSKRVRNELTVWLLAVLQTTLPRLAVAACATAARMPLEPVLTALQRLVDESFLPMDAVLAFKLSTLALTTPIMRDAAAAVTLLTEPSAVSDTCKSIVDATLVVCPPEPPDRESTAQLRQRLREVPLAAVALVKHEFHLVRLLESKDSEVSAASFGLVELVAQTKDFAHTDFSAMQQTGALLFGLSLLMQHADDNDQRRLTRASALSYLKNLLARYPHLGISLLPVMLDQLNTASTVQPADGLAVQELLEFLCQVLVTDPHCAQEIWNLVGVECMGVNVPLAVRVSLIRLYPAMCVANKRLYKRVIETLRVCVTDKAVEVRLAVAVTLADLAKNDSIRDVADVIGWIQSLLTEERSSTMHSLLVHYAVMSLHYLVCSQELDFEVVLKVLSKRLCPVTDLHAILKLPLVVLEALVLLLGDGECNQDDSDQDGLDDFTLLSVSPQVSRAIETLIRLGNALGDQSQTYFDGNPASIMVLSIVKRNIYESLSRYSINTLGVNEDGIREVSARLDAAEDEKPSLSRSAIRYSSLQVLLLDGLETQTSSTQTVESDRALLDVTSRLLEYEEEVLGGSLWQKRGRRKQAKVDKASNALLSTMPSAADIQLLTAGKNSPAAAIALLLASDGTQLSVLRDNGDASIDTSDPLFLVFAVQGYLNFAARTVSREGQDIGKLLTGVSGFLEIFLSPDTIYLALSALSIYIPHTQCEPAPSQTTYVEEIIDDVMGAFRNQIFQKEDVAKICLGLVGTSSLRYGITDRTDEIITILEQSVRGYGGQVSFGAYYALALICQALPQYTMPTTPEEVCDQIKRLICRVAGFLIEELLSCFEGSGDALLSLVACVKSGTATADLVGLVSSLESNSISLLMTKHVAARYLFVSCAYSLPALAAVDGRLLLATFYLLNAFEWGSGNAIALVPVLHACQLSSLLETIELERLYADYAGDFDARTCGDTANMDTEGLEDIFYAVTGTSTEPTPHVIRKLLVGNSDLFDDDGRALSLVACVLSLTSSRCLGATPFAVQVRLDVNAIQSDVDSIVEIVTEAATANDDSTYASMGVVMMGLLSAMRNPVNYGNVASPFPQRKEPVQSPPKEDMRQSVDFAMLPIPQIGTLLAGVVDVVERSCQFQSHGDEVNAMLTRAMQSLERLSLPGPFAKSFLEPMFRDNTPTPLGCTSLLCSQIRGRRRAIFDGSDFISLAVDIVTAPKNTWNNLLGDPSAQSVLIENLPAFGLKFTQESLAEAVQNVWRRILAQRNDSQDLISYFLSSLKELVQSTGLSPKALNTVRSFALGPVFTDLQKIPLDIIASRSHSDGISIIEAYVHCIKDLPLSMLDEAHFCRIPDTHDDTGEAVRVLVLLELVRFDFFGSPRRQSKELSKVISWISRKLPMSEDRSISRTLRRVITTFAEAARKENAEAQQTQIGTILENLLLVKKEGSRLAMEWLAVIAANWCDGRGSDADLSLGYLCTIDTRAVQALSNHCLEHLSQVMLVDLPFNLATFCRRNKLTATVLNQLGRLHGHWFKNAVDNHLLGCLQHCIICCRSSQTEEDFFVTLATSMLRKAP